MHDHRSEEGLEGGETQKKPQDVPLAITPSLAEELAAFRGDAQPTDVVFRRVPKLDTLYSDLERLGIAGPNGASRAARSIGTLSVRPWSSRS